MWSLMGNEITQLLERVSAGEPAHLAEVFERLYPQLRQIAAARLRAGERTLTPTVLVHELYLRATTGEPLSASDRRHFFTTAAKAMRWILVDHARRKAAGKRGGDLLEVTLTESLAQAPAPDVLDLHDGLEVLGEIAPQQRDIVELHYFGGLEFAEVAALLGTSERTVYRQWQRARAFLHARLR
ncbi:RNA polymerase subunit sigma [Pseudoxanthomonas broegbernensis]|uniref:RNA polymerase subunit sigma n=2 Tax=Pseudoxanthomonas broegbernensis TaxID=83619 RepID=A0A7V8GN30_9GAMM|nr:RNA polymerase subunit sigma [Pseudoxanthomonas broegbernensis]